MAKGDYYFPLYYQRFLASTTGWTDEQIGGYLRLLIYQFDNGFIPNDMKIIKRISPKAVKNWSLFRSKFEQNSEGNFINLVMENIRVEFNKRKEINAINGSKGGKRSSERLSERYTENPSIPIPIPLTNSRESPVLEEITPEILKSNIFRQPVIPTKDQVLKAILDAGGTKEMAKSFWLKCEGTNWFLNNSPIINYTALAQRFVMNWKSFEDKNENGSSGPPLEKLN